MIIFRSLLIVSVCILVTLLGCSEEMESLEISETPSSESGISQNNQEASSQNSDSSEDVNLSNNSESSSSISLVGPPPSSGEENNDSSVEELFSSSMDSEDSMESEDSSEGDEISSEEQPYSPMDIGSDKIANITKKCTSAPSKITAGESGWNSRYWDCCKPHCSVQQNTDNWTKNCSIDNEEIECFYEVGDEFWSGFENTKTGCQDDGEAFACYSHAPFAVCEDLAYGFAAVPGFNEDMCGSCFQLDYDGGFQHGEPKASHELMKGKTMIVMASNIGHDVAGGQFDIMIPGGGLGAFDAGCAVQWDVDPNNEQLVGKKFGGFTTTCQEKLGYEETPEAYKECVRGMCDDLFGNNASTHDLWEGCIWYVDWMHAVDNPTFTFTQVECPQTLLDAYGSSFH
ncbi:MAG: hypothetical protein OCD76_09040 [Reichenbachiella sp.]